MPNEDAIKKAIEDGASAEDIAADLADDGVMNNSHLTGLTANTSALDAATKTAEKLHKLLVTLIPILVLLSTSGLELSGIIDLTPAGDDDGNDEWFWEEEDNTYWGCTDLDAENYDEYATDDDGSCTYEEEEEPEPEPEPEPECEPEYYDYYVSYGDANNTTIEFTYDVDISCDEEQEVTIQFLAYVNGSGHGESPHNYTIDTFNTTYQDWDSRTVVLGDFENDTYDISAYLINDDGEMIKESIWFNVQLKARDES